MRRINPTKIQNTALFFILFAPFTILFYASYLFNPTNMGNIWLYLLQVLADAIAILNVGFLWLTILLDIVKPEYHQRDIVYNTQWLQKEKPTVDVLVPVANESIAIIQKTVSNVTRLAYPHEVYILDDGDAKEVKELAEKLHIHYIARPLHAKGYAKAGNLNYGLKHCHSAFFAVFDADHVPYESFLVELLPFFQNKKVALVQTPQHYMNTDNFIASGTAQAQEIFYKYVQPAKNSFNACFCVGTNMIYRRDAIEAVGGIAMLDHSEDIWTTILLHEKGFESVFYNKILAEGLAPETIPAFFRQQNRWARGGFSLFFQRNPLFISELTIDQRLQYFFSNIHYFSAFSILIYLTMPIVYLLTGIYAMNIQHSGDWLIHYVPYFITVYFLPFFLLGNLKLSTVSTAIASFYPYLQAFGSVVLKNKYTWVATQAGSKKFNFIIKDIWPHIFLITLSLLSILVGWYNVIDFNTTAMTTFWTLLNSYFLFAFIKNGLVQQEKQISVISKEKVSKPTQKFGFTRQIIGGVQ